MGMDEDLSRCSGRACLDDEPQDRDEHADQRQQVGAESVDAEPRVQCGRPHGPQQMKREVGTRPNADERQPGLDERGELADAFDDGLEANRHTGTVRP